MQLRASSSIVLLCLSGSLFAGCAYGEARQVIRAQFASELNCREIEIRRRDTWFAYDEGANQYKVIGCGETRTYTCPAHGGLVSYDKPACTWIKGDADAPVAAKEPAPDADEPPASKGEPPSPPANDEPPADDDAPQKP